MDIHGVLLHWQLDKQGQEIYRDSHRLDRYREEYRALAGYLGGLGQKRYVEIHLSLGDRRFERLQTGIFLYDRVGIAPKLWELFDELDADLKKYFFEEMEVSERPGFLHALCQHNLQLKGSKPFEIALELKDYSVALKLGAHFQSFLDHLRRRPKVLANADYRQLLIRFCSDKTYAANLLKVYSETREQIEDPWSLLFPLFDHLGKSERADLARSASGDPKRLEALLARGFFDLGESLNILPTPLFARHFLKCVGSGRLKGRFDLYERYRRRLKDPSQLDALVLGAEMAWLVKDLRQMSPERLIKHYARYRSFVGKALEETVISAAVQRANGPAQLVATYDEADRLGMIEKILPKLTKRSREPFLRWLVKQPNVRLPEAIIKEAIPYAPEASLERLYGMKDSVVNGEVQWRGYSPNARLLYAAILVRSGASTSDLAAVARTLVKERPAHGASGEVFALLSAKLERSKRKQDRQLGRRLPGASAKAIDALKTALEASDYPRAQSLVQQIGLSKAYPYVLAHAQKGHFHKPLFERYFKSKAIKWDRCLKLYQAIKKPEDRESALFPILVRAPGDQYDAVTANLDTAKVTAAVCHLARSFPEGPALDYLLKSYDNFAKALPLLKTRKAYPPILADHLKSACLDTSTKIVDLALANIDPDKLSPAALSYYATLFIRIENFELEEFITMSNASAKWAQPFLRRYCEALIEVRRDDVSAVLGALNVQIKGKRVFEHQTIHELLCRYIGVVAKGADFSKKNGVTPDTLQTSEAYRNITTVNDRFEHAAIAFGVLKKKGAPRSQLWTQMNQMVLGTDRSEGDRTIISRHLEQKDVGLTWMLHAELDSMMSGRKPKVVAAGKSDLAGYLTASSYAFINSNRLLVLLPGKAEEVIKVYRAVVGHPLIASAMKSDSLDQDILNLIQDASVLLGREMKNSRDKDAVDFMWELFQDFAKRPNCGGIKNASLFVLSLFEKLEGDLKRMEELCIWSLGANLKTEKGAFSICDVPEYRKRVHTALIGVLQSCVERKNVSLRARLKGLIKQHPKVAAMVLRAHWQWVIAVFRDKDLLKEAIEEVKMGDPYIDRDLLAQVVIQQLGKGNR